LWDLAAAQGDTPLGFVIDGACAPDEIDQAPELVPGLEAGLFQPLDPILGLPRLCDGLLGLVPLLPVPPESKGGWPLPITKTYGIVFADRAIA